MKGRQARCLRRERGDQEEEVKKGSLPSSLYQLKKKKKIEGLKSAKDFFREKKKWSSKKELHCEKSGFREKKKEGKANEPNTL